jgi:DNA-binding beta-propeller fold protein YncE
VKRALLLVAILAVPAASHAARQGGTPVALVTAESENALLVVDLGSRKVVRTLPMPADPENVETNSTDSAAAVVSTQAGAVTLFSLPRLRVRRTIRGFASPHIAAFSPNGHYLYVTDDARGQLVVIGVRKGKVLNRLFVGRGAHHIAVRPDAKKLWIVLGERAREIVIVDTRHAARPWVAGRLFDGDLGGLAHDATFAPSGRRVWVTYDDKPTIAVFDARTYRVLLRLPAGSPPQHVGFGIRFGYVTSGNDGRLRVFSFAGRQLGVARTPRGSFNLGLGGGLVLTSSLTQGTLTELRDSGTRMWSGRVAPAARDAAVAVLP